MERTQYLCAIKETLARSAQSAMRHAPNAKHYLLALGSGGMVGGGRVDASNGSANGVARVNSREL